MSVVYDVYLLYKISKSAKKRRGVEMREYDMLRIQLLKTLLQMEEKLLEGLDKEKNQPNIAIESRGKKVPLQKDEIPLKAVFSVSELADYLGISTDSIYTMVRENQIPYVRIRRRILFNREAINSWVHAE